MLTIQVNHAAVTVGDKVYSFGGYCTGNNYKKIKPMEVNVLQSGTTLYIPIF